MQLKSYNPFNIYMLQLFSFLFFYKYEEEYANNQNIGHITIVIYLNSYNYMCK